MVDDNTGSIRGSMILFKPQARPVLSRLAAACLAFCATVPVSQSSSACSLALVIAMDGSSSVSPEEHNLQLRGLAEALNDGDVRTAIQAVGGIWFSSFEWSGRYQQTMQVGWRYLNAEDSITQTAADLARSKRGYTEFPTALGYALGYASNYLAKVPGTCARKVIDVAGDGINNEGFDAAAAYRAFAFDGITVNGLAIAGAKPDPVAYYRDKVIRGPGAFVEVAKGFDDYKSAMKRKLLREIGTANYASLQPELRPETFSHGRR